MRYIILAAVRLTIPPLITSSEPDENYSLAMTIGLMS